MNLNDAADACSRQDKRGATITLIRVATTQPRRKISSTALEMPEKPARTVLATMPVPYPLRILTNPAALHSIYRAVQAASGPAGRAEPTCLVS